MSTFLQVLTLAAAMYTTMGMITHIWADHNANRATVFGAITCGLWAFYIVYYLGGWF